MEQFLAAFYATAGVFVGLALVAAVVAMMASLAATMIAAVGKVLLYVKAGARVLRRRLAR